jgi:hypothetical protein
METVSTSETSVSFYQTTRRNIPEDSHIKIFSASYEQILKSCVCFFFGGGGDIFLIPGHVAWGKQGMHTEF